MTTDAYEIFAVKIFLSVCGAMTIKCTKSTSSVYQIGGNITHDTVM